MFGYTSLVAHLNGVTTFPSGLTSTLFIHASMTTTCSPGDPRFTCDHITPDVALGLSIEQLIGGLNRKLFMKCTRVQGQEPPPISCAETCGSQGGFCMSGFMY